MRVALVTGASGGLGSALASGLDRMGFRVIIHYHSNVEAASGLAKRLKNSPILIRADLSNYEEVKGASEKLRAETDRLDLIVNNASITHDALLLRLKESEWDRVVKVNLKGAFNTVKHFCPLMIESGGGHIINISSFSGLRGKAGQAAYASTKAALIGFSLTLARELSGYNIKVNTIVPGYLPVGMGARAEEAMKRARLDSLLDSLSNTERVVEFIGFLIKHDITGQVFCLESRI
ncbi:MAG: SDR family NAD(P)-dependent oxidoreductase [Nitrospirae bacterium]|nr:SDR family NAD(P)-dependent oxidoreductase [Nitrospirota bacterium]